MRKNFLLAGLALSIALTAQTQSALDREPPGSKTLTFIDHKNDSVIYSNTVSGSNWTLKINHPPPAISPPYTYKHKETQIVFYIESDGRHITALDPSGKILWCRQPGTDGKLPPYSESYPKQNPSIVWIGALTASQSEHLKQRSSGNFLGISFSSRQAGALDLKNGDFTFWGQD